MNIRRIQKPEEERVVIECVEVTREVRDICAYALTKGREIAGTAGERSCRFKLEEVYYFEAVDEKVFACTQEQVYEIKARLYQVERDYEENHFVRCSKSVVMNLMLLEGISPALNGRFYAHMKNGERLMISRQYVKEIRKIIMGEDGRRENG